MFSFCRSQSTNSAICNAHRPFALTGWQVSFSPITYRHFSIINIKPFEWVICLCIQWHSSRHWAKFNWILQLRFEYATAKSVDTIVSIVLSHITELNPSNIIMSNWTGGRYHIWYGLCAKALTSIIETNDEHVENMAYSHLAFISEWDNFEQTH